MSNELEELSTEELRKLSQEKDKLGCATKEALQAQFILYKQARRGFSRNHNPYGMHRGGEFLEDFGI